MAWIDVVPPDAATGELAAVYEAIGAARGAVAAVHQVQSLHPRAMRAHLELYRTVVLARSSLSRRDRERIAVVVSHANGCAYCVAHHAEAMRNVGEDPETAADLAAGRVPEALGEPVLALLAWVRKIADRPEACTAEDTAALRAKGWDDRAILDAALTASYFAFVNRLVLSLGVHLEPDYQRSCGAVDGSSES